MTHPASTAPSGEDAGAMATVNQEQEALLAEPDVIHAKLLVGSFLKALKSFRLYQPNSKILIEFVETFHRELDEFQNRYGRSHPVR